LTLLLLGAAISGGCGGGHDSSAPSTTSTTSLTPSISTTATTTTGASDDGVTTPPPAFTIRGRGPTTRSITAPNDYRPVLILARYPRTSILTIHLRGEGFDRSRDESGVISFSGSPVSFDGEPGLASGQYDLSVTGVKGPWSLQFAVPDAAASAFQMFEKPIVARYDNIAKVHLAEESEIKWQMQTDAPMMSAKLVGYGEAEGTEQFLGIVQGALELGPAKHGFRSDAPMPAGDYVLVVDADGRWGIKFSPAG
jgi:hypothetical protein